MKHLTIGGVVFLLLCAGGTRLRRRRLPRRSTNSPFSSCQAMRSPLSTSAAEKPRAGLGKLSRDELILVNSDDPAYGEVDVATISQRRDDSLTNGAIIGAVAGTAFFATAATLLRDSDGGEVIISTAIAWGVLFAVGWARQPGWGFHALISRRHVIYQKPALGAKSAFHRCSAADVGAPQSR